MKQRILCAAVAALVGAASACSRQSPTQPSAPAAAVTDSVELTASIAAPRPVSPVNNAPVRNVDQPVTLVVANALITQGAVPTYTFEVGADASFNTKAQTKDNIAQGADGRTSVRLDALPAGADYWWHARATGGGTTGVYGPAYRFTVGPAVVVNAPVPISPLTGAQTVARPAFRVTNATRQGPAGSISYRFDISTSSTFGSIIATTTVPEGVNETGFIPGADLPIDATLFWRAVAIDPANGVTSAASAPQSFTTSLAIDLSKAVFLRGPDLSTWRETGRIIAVEQDGNQATGGLMCISFTDPGWPDVKWPYGQPGDDPNFGIYGNQWYFAKINGTWYGGAGEWLYRGAATCKAGQGTRTIGPDSGFGNPFSSWVPKPGELVGYAVSASARAYPAMFSVAERTNVVLHPWRDSSLASAIQNFSVSQALGLWK